MEIELQSSLQKHKQLNLCSCFHQGEEEHSTHERAMPLIVEDTDGKREGGKGSI